MHASKTGKERVHELVGELIRANWHRGHLWLMKQAPIADLIEAWPWDIIEARLPALTALLQHAGRDVHDAHKTTATACDSLPFQANPCSDDNGPATNMPDLENVSFDTGLRMSNITSSCSRDVFKIVRTNWHRGCWWLSRQASFEVLIRSWPYNIEDSLATFKELVFYHGQHHVASAWQHVPEGKFTEAFVQAVPPANLRDLDFVLIHQLDALLTVQSWTKEQLLMKVLLGRARDPDYLIQVKYFVLRAFEQNLTRELVLEMNQHCGTYPPGVAFFVATGFLREDDVLRRHK